MGDRTDRTDRSADRTSPPVAVITGGSQGLGLALARGLAEEGWRLVIDARRPDRLATAAAELATRTEVAALAGDVSEPAHREALAAAAADLGPVRLLVNNASTLGASPLPRLAEVDPEVLRRTFEVNAVAPVALVQALLPHLAPGATVLDITSDAAVEAYEGWGAYGASKAALEHLTRTLAAEHPDLRVLAVDPGDLRTEMHQDAFPGEDITDRPTPDTVVPALLDLVAGDAASGRYRAPALVGGSA